MNEWERVAERLAKKIESTFEELALANRALRKCLRGTGLRELQKENERLGVVIKDVEEKLKNIPIQRPKEAIEILSDYATISKEVGQGLKETSIQMLQAQGLEINEESLSK